MSQPRTRLFLVHEETGQRYPIRSDIVIGRAQGDLVFSRDARLSQEHCRISPTPEGLMVQDLNSANGTMINGKRIALHRSHPLGVGDELCVGSQAFTALTVTKAKPTARRKKKKHKFDLGNLLLTGVLAVLILGLIWTYKQKLFPTARPRNAMQTAQRELIDTFENYTTLKSSLDHQTTPPKDVVARIQSQILIRLNGVSTRLSDINPTDARERQMLNLEQLYIAALTSHAKSRVQFINNGGDLTTQEELDGLEEKMDQIASEYHDLIDPHGPANPGLPMQIQSPWQIVEKEMRRALFNYQVLGTQVREGKVAEKEMANIIRRDLLPKLTTVSAKLDVIKAESPNDKKKIAQEKQLISAFLSQLKAMASFADTKDPKFALEQEKWGAEIQKLNSAMKAPRAPAGAP